MLETGAATGVNGVAAAVIVGGAAAAAVCAASAAAAFAAAAAAFYSNHFAGLGNVPVAATPPPAHMGITAAAHLDPKTGIPRGAYDYGNDVMGLSRLSAATHLDPNHLMAHTSFTIEMSPLSD